MTHRTCEADGCERKHQARGMCVSHWSAWYRQQFKAAGHRSHHPNHLRTCATCGGQWYTPRAEAKFCTAKCKGVYLSERNRTKSKLPADHPVMLLIAADKEARRLESAERRRLRAIDRQRSDYSWRTARECPGCACMFTPIHTPTMLTCSKRCARRVSRWRRRAAETNAVGSYIWSDFMRVARRFDFRCAYCGERPAGLLDPDHVVPLSRGGLNSTTNLLPSCRPCNSDKRDLLLDEWATDRSTRGKPPRMTSWPAEDKRYWHLTQVTMPAVA